MDNDKAFATYALLLIAGTASVITASVMAGFASLPSPLVFLEHIALSFAFRAAYKSFAGFDWSDWNVFEGEVAEVTALPGRAAEADAGISQEAA